MREIIISCNEANQRFDKFLLKYLSNASASFIYKMLRKKNIVLNDKKDDGKTILKIGDKVNIYIKEDSIVNFIKENNIAPLHAPQKKLDIIYECEDYIIFNKPVGMLSQKAEKDDISANEYLIDYMLKNGEITKESLMTFKPSICNRLDRNTSGILVFGKTLSGTQTFNKAFKERTMHKYYLCIVKGDIKDFDKIDAYLKKDEKTNKVYLKSDYDKDYEHIITEYRKITTNGSYSLVEINLITGKTHQIRAHLSYIGHPLIGDYKYGDKKTNDYFKDKYKMNSQLLHAYKLVYNDNTYIAPIPDKFKEIILGESLEETCPPGIQEALEAQF